MVKSWVLAISKLKTGLDWKRDFSFTLKLWTALPNYGNQQLWQKTLAFFSSQTVLKGKMKNNSRKRNKWPRNHPWVLIFSSFLPTEAFNLTEQGIQKYDYIPNSTITELEESPWPRIQEKKMYLLIWKYNIDRTRELWRLID